MPLPRYRAPMGCSTGAGVADQAVFLLVRAGCKSFARVADDGSSKRRFCVFRCNCRYFAAAPSLCRAIASINKNYSHIIVTSPACDPHASRAAAPALAAGRHCQLLCSTLLSESSARGCSSPLRRASRVFVPPCFAPLQCRAPAVGLATPGTGCTAVCGPGSTGPKPCSGQLRSGDWRRAGGCGRCALAQGNGGQWLALRAGPR